MQRGVAKVKTRHTPQQRYIFELSEAQQNEDIKVSDENVL